MRRLWVGSTAFILTIAMVMLSVGGNCLAQLSSEPEIPAPSGAPPGQAPKIKLLEPLYNFGTALEGEMVRHTFKIQNVGKGTLIIRGVKTSCGCTAAKPSKTQLAPGEVASIDVGFDTRFHKGNSHRTITVFSNDPNNPQAVMELQGLVKAQVAAEPSQVDFGTVEHGQTEVKEVKIIDLTKGKRFKVGPISNSNPNLKVVQEPSAPGKPDVIKVTLLKTMPMGAFDDTINVVTNRVPIPVYVFGTVQGDLSVDPVQVSFGIVPRGQGVVRYVRLVNSSARAVKVLGVSSSNHSVEATVEPLKPGKEYKITVHLRQNTPDGQLHGQLAIKTDDPHQQTLTVPFYAIVGRFEG
jgi:Protein of unknown function (DUF1573)/Flagellar-associated PapD-like